MAYSESLVSRSHIEQLMDIAATLADYTHSPELAIQLPVYLSRMLALEPLTLAVVHQVATEDTPEVVLLGSSGQIAVGEAGASFHRHILDIHRQTRPLTVKDHLALRDAFASSSADADFSEMTLTELVTFPRALVFARSINSTHRMLLIVHQRVQDPLPTTAQTDTLTLVAAQLAKLLSCMVALQTQPEFLGNPFNHLTDREWMVLRALNSDEGEKQLADHLGLSPHTLHSHIKSIYRKVGVQGRLPLLLRLHQAIREVRTTVVNTTMTDAPLEQSRQNGQNHAMAFA